MLGIRHDHWHQANAYFGGTLLVLLQPTAHTREDQIGRIEWGGGQIGRRTFDFKFKHLPIEPW